MTNVPFQAIVVGPECLENLRLSNILRKFLGTKQVFRYLEMRHLVEFLAAKDRRATGIFFDLFGFPINEATQAIGLIRDQYPDVVFCIHLSYSEYELRWKELPERWQNRLEHYFRLYKEPEDTEMKPLVKLALELVRGLAISNLYERSLRVSNGPEKIGKSYLDDNSSQLTDNMLFISYSRQDWDVFVSPMVNRLRDRGFSVWIDQNLLVGGVDWMDVIGKALNKCKLLILVMTPEAIESRFVKMEYRYFFNHGKPIVPLLYRSVEHIPPELSLIQHIDFTIPDTTAQFSQLIRAITLNLQK
jgi:hypothetical protein